MSVSVLQAVPAPVHRPLMGSAFRPSTSTHASIVSWRQAHMDSTAPSRLHQPPHYEPQSQPHLHAHAQGQQQPPSHYFQPQPQSYSQLPPSQPQPLSPPLHPQALPQPYEDDAGPSSRPVKKSRVRQACLPCSTKRTKCSGGFPCDACVRGGVDCVYREPKKRGPPKGSARRRLSPPMAAARRRSLSQSHLPSDPMRWASNSHSAPTTSYGMPERLNRASSFPAWRQQNALGGPSQPSPALTESPLVPPIRHAPYPPPSASSRSGSPSDDRRLPSLREALDRVRIDEVHLRPLMSRPVSQPQVRQLHTHLQQPPHEPLNPLDYTR